MPALLRTTVVSVGVALLLASSSVLRAAEIVTSVTVEVTSTHPALTNIDVGDRFDVTFTVDDSTVDSNASGDSGLYPELVKQFSMTAHTQNSGSWLPSGTTNPELGDYSSSDALDRLTLQIGGSGYPDGGGISWEGFVAYIHWPSGELVDTGAGETLSEQLGAPFGIPPGELDLRILFVDIRRVAAFEARLEVVETSIVEMPTASTWALIALAALLASFGLRRLG